MDFKRSAVIVLGIIAGIAGYYFGAYLSGNGDDDQDTEDLVELTVNNTRDAFLGPLITVDQGGILNEKANVRSLSEEDRKANPCYWCMKVENQSASEKLYDCDVPCPCANAPVKSEEADDIPNKSILRVNTDLLTGGGVGPGDGGTVSHLGGVIIDSYFSLYDGTGIGQDASGACLGKDDNADGITTVEFFYVAEVDCEVQNTDSLDFLSMTYSLSETGRSYFVDSIDLKNAVIQTDLCCERDSICYVSAVFSLELDDTFLSDSTNEVYFQLEAVHPDSHQDGNNSHLHSNASSLANPGRQVNRTYSSQGNGDHKEIIQFSISVCSP